MSNKIQYGWICIRKLTVTEEIRKAYSDVQYPDQYEVGDTVPSWLYAALPRKVRETNFTKNTQIKF